ncbi:hypothetical protein N800_00380 [Lysobacter daejeonensis GH1-9]|uniref:Glycosyltransferase RgtA/B/C/D-like domain-containing protein n=2 Tax=Aerolutibacter TaxID=3382701 RepID=A0A0A0EXW2_9GAMM|nr:hypothetical protein N800_00380 [Lysobacter daejeonensis GH1-9]
MSTPGAVDSMRTSPALRQPREIVAAFGILVASLVTHLWLPLLHPTPLISDFLGIVTFASDLAEHGPFAPGWYWNFFSAGTPTFLSIPLALSGADDATVARVVTATVLAMLPLIPLLVLRGVLPLWSRLLVAGILTLLPSLVVFSGVVAQDNWVQLPTLALASLAVRNACGEGRGYPVWSALLWCVALYVRQEMLVALLPLALLAAWPVRHPPAVRSLVLFSGVALVLMLGVASQRQIATGDFSLASRHGGSSMLGSYVPGAGFGWIAHDDFIAWREPALSGDAERVRAEAGRLAIEEIRARPFFHLVRRAGAVLDTATTRDGTLQYWAFAADDGVTGGRSPVEAASAARLGQVSSKPVLYASILLHALFLGAAYLGFKTRDRALMAIAIAVLLKVGIHFVVAVQARFFLVVFVLEALAIGVAAARLHHSRASLRGTGIVALASGLLLLGATTGLDRLNEWVRAQDAAWVTAGKRQYRVRLPHAVADCQLEGGRVLSAGPSGFMFAVEHSDPEPGEYAELRCQLAALGDGGEVTLEVEDRYAPGGFLDRMFQVVEIGDATVRRHDVAAEAGSGWWRQRIPVAAGTRQAVRIRVEALRPDKGPGWGNAAQTSVRFTEAQ